MSVGTLNYSLSITLAPRTVPFIKNGWKIKILMLLKFDLQVLLDNFPQHDVMTFCARLCLLFQMITVFPLLVYIIRVQLFTMLFKNIYPGLVNLIFFSVFNTLPQGRTNNVGAPILTGVTGPSHLGRDKVLRVSPTC